MVACAHCPGGAGLARPLDDGKFLVVCDCHPLAEGHILIIPRQHVSCFGALGASDFEQFEEVYNRVQAFLKKRYSATAAFEHGVAGQTVFHAHMHCLPFDGTIADLGLERMHEIHDLDILRKEYSTKGKYLFVHIGGKSYLVDTEISVPRFFRDRFAHALGVDERGDWKKAGKNRDLRDRFAEDIRNLEEKW